MLQSRFLLTGRSGGQVNRESQGEGKCMRGKSTYTFLRVGHKLVFSQCELRWQNSVLINLPATAFNLSREIVKRKFKYAVHPVLITPIIAKVFNLTFK